MEKASVKEILNGHDDTKYITPRGAGKIVEAGSNEKGTWVKYANGVMVCSGKTRLSAADSVFDKAYGSVYYNGKYTSWDFPQLFKEAPIVTATAYFQGGLGGYCIASEPNTKGVAGYLYYFTSYDFGVGGTVSGRAGANFKAVGWWK